eukprot:9898254-Karenia_brevis.AAC.1
MQHAVTPGMVESANTIDGYDCRLRVRFSSGAECPCNTFCACSGGKCVLKGVTSLLKVGR